MRKDRRLDSSVQSKRPQRYIDSSVAGQYGGVDWSKLGSSLLSGATRAIGSETGQQVIGNLLAPASGALGELIAKKISGQGLRLAGQKGVGLTLAGRGKKKTMKRK